MSTVLKLRRGTTAEHSTFTGDQGEVTVDTQKKSLVVHDGLTPGGIPAAKEVNPVFSGTLTHSGDVLLSGSGKRILGDFSNSTIANRLMFKTSVAHSATDIGVMPSGNAGRSTLNLYSVSDPGNAHVFSVSSIYNSDIRLAASYTGTPSAGTYLPMTFHTGGAERMRIDTSGNVGIGSTPAANTRLSSYAAAGNTPLYAVGVGGSMIVDYLGAGVNYINAATTVFRNTAGTINVLDITQGSGVLVKEAVGLGYGTGAGGTVTQSTSKATAVTLNKPTGAITTTSDALAANAAVFFTVNNSLVTANDTVVLSLRSGDATGGSYSYGVQAVQAGSFLIFIRNVTGASRSEALAFNFAIIKGATA